MASYLDVIRGLRLFAKREGEEKHGITAEHDTIWAGHDSAPESLSEAERTELEFLGWSYDHDVMGWRHYA